MITEKYKRKNIIINRKFQFNLIGTFLISIGIALIIFTAAISLYYWISSMAGENIFKEFITIERQVIEQREVKEEGQTRLETFYTTKTIPGVKRWEIVVPPILINNLIILIVITVMGIYYSHRIAGPAYRMIVDIQKVIDGEKDVRIHLRRKDKLTDLADKVNLLIEKFEKIT